MPGGDNHRLDSYQAVGGKKGQRLQHDRIHHAEDRCRCANPERQGRDGNRRKAGVPEHSQAVAQVCDDLSRKARSQRLAAFFLVPLIAAKLHTRPPLRLHTQEPLTLQVIRTALQCDRSSPSISRSTRDRWNTNDNKVRMDDTSFILPPVALSEQRRRRQPVPVSSLAHQTEQGRIKRPLLDYESSIRNLLNPKQNAISIQYPKMLRSIRRTQLTRQARIIERPVAARTNNRSLWSRLGKATR